MTIDHTIPQYSLDTLYQVIIPTRGEWEKDEPERLRNGQVWFTNGACNQQDWGWDPNLEVKNSSTPAGTKTDGFPGSGSSDTVLCDWMSEGGYRHAM